MYAIKKKKFLIHIQISSSHGYHENTHTHTHKKQPTYLPSLSVSDESVRYVLDNLKIRTAPSFGKRRSSVSLSFVFKRKL